MKNFTLSILTRLLLSGQAFAICFLSFTFYSKAQTITLGSNAPSAANQCAGTTKVVIQSFSLEVTVSDGNLTDVGFTTTGTYVQADITKYQLWYQPTTNDISGAIQLGTDLASSGGAGTRTFAAFTSPTLTSGITYYFWITADIAAVVTNNNTIAVNGIATTNLTSTSTTAGGPTTAGGTQTLIATPTNEIIITSGPFTDMQTVCINTVITNITYATSGATGATFTGLPAGVTGNYAERSQKINFDYLCNKF